jgi:hypothetical protein
MRSLRNSGKSYKTQLTRKYKMHSRNIKTPQIKTWEDTKTAKWTHRGLHKTPKWNKGDYKKGNIWHKEDNTRY